MLSSITLDDDRRLDEMEARRVADEVRSSNGPELALEQARKYATAARDQLRFLPTSEAVDTLASLTDYVVSRKL
jgi:geranylgeranyl pyrophosphate synthase